MLIFASICLRPALCSLSIFIPPLPCRSFAWPFYCSVGVQLLEMCYLVIVRVPLLLLLLIISFQAFARYVYSLVQRQLIDQSWMPGHTILV
jgi:hypothetical protein